MIKLSEFVNVFVLVKFSVKSLKKYFDLSFDLEDFYKVKEINLKEELYDEIVDKLGIVFKKVNLSISNYEMGYYYLNIDDFSKLEFQFYKFSYDK